MGTKVMPRPSAAGVLLKVETLGYAKLTDTSLGSKRKAPMKTQMQKSHARKAKYIAEYKQQALEHWRNNGRSMNRVFLFS